MPRNRYFPKSWRLGLATLAHRIEKRIDQSLDEDDWKRLEGGYFAPLDPLELRAHWLGAGGHLVACTDRTLGLSESLPASTDAGIVLSQRNYHRAVVDLHSSASRCRGCAGPASVEIEFSAVRPGEWVPYCESCHERMSAEADEVNQHEMDRFGGAYGLVEWLVRPLVPKRVPQIGARP